MCIVMKNLFFVTCLLLVLVGCNTNGSMESFKDNGYQEDTVYISGKVQNFPEGGNLLIAYPKSVEASRNACLSNRIVWGILKRESQLSIVSVYIYMVL